MWRAGKAKGKEEAYYPSETGFKFLMFLNVRCERLNPQIHTLSPLSLGQFCVMDSGPQLQFVSLKPPRRECLPREKVRLKRPTAANVRGSSHYSILACCAPNLPMTTRIAILSPTRMLSAAAS